MLRVKPTTLHFRYVKAQTCQFTTKSIDLVERSRALFDKVISVCKQTQVEESWVVVAGAHLVLHSVRVGHHIRPRHRTPTATPDRGPARSPPHNRIRRSCTRWFWPNPQPGQDPRSPPRLPPVPLRQATQEPHRSATPVAERWGHFRVSV